MEYTMQDLLTLMEFMSEHPAMAPDYIVRRLLEATEVLEAYNRKMSEIMAEACCDYKPKLEVLKDPKKGD
jgi:hypothetical protein